MKVVIIASLIFMGMMIGSRPIIPLLASEWGANSVEVGLIVAFYAFLPLLLAVPIGSWIDRHGAKRPIIVAIVLGGFSLILPYFISNIFGIYISQLIGGLSVTLFVIASQSYVGFLYSDKKREKAIILFSLGVSAGSLIGPLLSGFLTDILGFKETLVIMGIIGISTILFVFLLADARANVPNRSKTEKINFIELISDSNLRKSFLISALIMLTKDLYLAYFPLIASELGYTMTTIGVLISIHNGAGLLVRSIIPKLVFWFGKSEVILYSLICAGVLFALIPFFNQMFMLIIICFLLGISIGIGQPLSISSSIRFAPDDSIGEVLGLRITAVRVSQVVGPLLFGGIATVVGIYGLFWSVGIVVMLGSSKTFIDEESKVNMNKG